MAWMIPAAIFGGALLGGSASRSAASQQSDAAKQASELQRQQFSEQALLQEPFRQVGIRALPQLEAQRNMMPGAFTGKVNLGQDPGYAFRLSEGQKALDRSAAARGGLISGGAMKAAQATTVWRLWRVMAKRLQVKLALPGRTWRPMWAT
jgi:hypothetical protein